MLLPLPSVCQSFTNQSPPIYLITYVVAMVTNYSNWLCQCIANHYQSDPVFYIIILPMITNKSPIHHYQSSTLLIRIFFQRQKCAVMMILLLDTLANRFFTLPILFFNMPLPLVFLVVCSKQINQCTPMLASIIFLSELNRTEAHWA